MSTPNVLPVPGPAPLVEVRASSRLVVRKVSPETIERVVAVLAPVLLLGLWEALTRSNVLDQRFFPAPSSIVDTFYHMTFKMPWDNSLAYHVLISLSRALIGFLLGAIPAIAIGAIMGLVPIVRAAVQPIVGALFPIPKVAILPLLMLVFGIGEESKWAIIAIGVFFQVLIATAAGVSNIDRIYLDVGANFKAGRIATYTTIAFPGALPMIVAGLRLGWGSSLLLLVTAEMVSSQSGVGFLIWRAWQLMTVEDMYVGLVVIACIGITSFWLIDALESRLLPWKRR
ncbi:ABC transporter permease [Polaromonas jejuensis]|uniref:ABC transporter permease n=1 Tax=Polaromonas jejuensis TaxID=457502 RepID=A0ABW0Q8Z7_9BURK|nr:ABC transporter permease [Polaromonas jejuensis]